VTYPCSNVCAQSELTVNTVHILWRLVKDIVLLLVKSLKVLVCREPVCCRNTICSKVVYEVFVDMHGANAVSE